MITSSIRHSLGLAYLSRYSIVYGYVKRRSPFDKTQYIENYVDRPNKYNKSRKPKLAEWTDPNVVWPLVLPSPTKLVGKSLVKYIEAKEKEIIRSQKNYAIPDFRTGDVLEVTYMLSVSEGKTNTIKGLCVAVYKRNSLEASFGIVFRAAGNLVQSKMQLHTPMIIDFKILKKSSGNLRNKLFGIFGKDFEQQQLIIPLKKKKTMKRRNEDPPRTTIIDGKKDKIEDNFDEILN